jgi:hypothetical protein
VLMNTTAGRTAWLNNPSGVGTGPGSQVLSGFGTLNYPLGSFAVSGELSNLESLNQFHSPQFFVYVVNGSLITTPSSPILARIDNDTSAIRNWEIRCDEGNYCVNGTRLPCAQGHYGDERGLITPNCSGLCRQGYYCPEGSSRDTQEVCGGTGFYCPTGSYVPTAVSKGYYTIGVHVPIVPCPLEGFEGSLSCGQVVRMSQRDTIKSYARQDITAILVKLSSAHPVVTAPQVACRTPIAPAPVPRGTTARPRRHQPLRYLRSFGPFCCGVVRSVRLALFCRFLAGALTCFALWEVAHPPQWPPAITLRAGVITTQIPRKR